ncbi:MAG TPA: hypothetical protein VMB27_13100 [Solirubrobacteraceae bacterium]|nr:hypothetical protein [Solirubrobacteraceae bacterium]
MPFSVRRARLRPRDLVPDRYLTDGRRLFRVVSRFVNDGSVLVVIEDSLTLDARAYAAVELLAMGLRPVRVTRRTPQVTELVAAGAGRTTGGGVGSLAASSG